MMSLERRAATRITTVLCTSDLSLPNIIAQAHTIHLLKVNAAMPEISTYAELEKLIQQEFRSLSAQLQRAAKYALDQPSDIALLSMRAVALRAKVQPATMTRLSHRLSFASYKQFQNLFSERLRGVAHRYVDRANTLQTRKASREPERIIGECFESDVENFNLALKLVIEPLAASAAVIKRARRVFVVGRRICYPVAFLFYYSYHMFRENATLLDDRGSAIQDGLIDMTSRDVLLAVSFEPCSRETVEAVRYASEIGAKIVAITDSSTSPLAEKATHVVVLPDTGSSFFHSIAAATVAVRSLIEVLVSDGGKSAVTALKANEAHRKRLGGYWTD